MLSKSSGLAQALVPLLGCLGAAPRFSLSTTNPRPRSDFSKLPDVDALFLVQPERVAGLDAIGLEELWLVAGWLALAVEARRSGKERLRPSPKPGKDE